MAANERNPGLAAVLSFLIPGLGQVYNGCILRGVIWFLVAGGTWIGSAGMLGWIIHIISAVTAYNFARRHLYR